MTEEKLINIVTLIGGFNYETHLRRKRRNISSYLVLPEQTNYPIGKYDRMCLDYLKQHRRGTYTTLLTSCTLNQHLYETEQEEKYQIDLTLSRLVKERGITEKLKATDPLHWVQEMNNAKHDAEEIVMNEIIYN